MAPFLGTDNLECLQHDGRLHRRQRIGEGAGTAEIAQILLHGDGIAGHETAIRGKGLGKAAHHQIDFAGHLLPPDMAAAVLADIAEIMCDIDQQFGAVFVTKILQ